MSDDTSPSTGSAPEQSAAAAAEQPPVEPQADNSSAATESPDEWKPEPRQWTWRDLFTAPMLAFKPKCMVIAIATLVLLSLFGWLWIDLLMGKTGAGNVALLGPAMSWLGLALAAAIFGLGATLIAVFMRADLLDDEFLSLGEALGQFKGRLLAAALVPTFIVALVAGFNLCIYIAMLVGSIPVAGGILYAILYPLGFLLALFTVLLGIAALLSIFIGPAVIAVRKHGWFDNVIDVFEAVGTKPHQVVASLIITLIVSSVCVGIGFGSMHLLQKHALSDNLYSSELPRVEGHADQWRAKALQVLGDPSILLISSDAAAELQTIIAKDSQALREQQSQDQSNRIQAIHQQRDNGTITADEARTRIAAIREEAPHKAHDNLRMVSSGLLTGIWKTIFHALLIGYGLCIFIAGGVLTYLAVREDDYWDDEDLEDLDQLAKELEEEARKEEEAAAKDPALAPTITPDQANTSATAGSDGAASAQGTSNGEADAKPSEEATTAADADATPAEEPPAKAESDDGADKPADEPPKSE